jgi:hypothetical protein
MIEVDDMIFGKWWPVAIEHEWYDGPRSGIFLVADDRAWYFQSSYDDIDSGADRFQLWPCNPQDLDREGKSWRIFVAWNELYEAGRVGTDTHPGHTGIDPRYDELAIVLESSREPPTHAVWAALSMRQRSERRSSGRYHADGVDYEVRFERLPTSGGSDENPPLI